MSFPLQVMVFALHSVTVESKPTLALLSGISFLRRKINFITGKKEEEEKTKTDEDDEEDTRGSLLNGVGQAVGGIINGVGSAIGAIGGGIRDAIG